MVCVEDWLKTPVGDGNIRLHGQWTGTIHVPGHCLDVHLPLQYDIPLVYAEQLVNEFIAQDEADKAKDSEVNEGGDDAKQGGSDEKKNGEKRHNLLHVWHELSVFLKTDSSIRSQSALPALTSATMGIQRESSFTPAKYNQLKHEDDVMKIDMNALNLLVEELREKNDELAAENEKLKHEYNQGMLGRWLDHLRHRDPSDDGSSSSDSEKEEDAEKPPKLNTGDLWLKGHFMGTAMTHKHVLDIMLPFQGSFEGHRAVDVLKAVANQEELVKTGRGRKQKTTWEQFAQLVEHEYANVAEQAKPADTGNTDMLANGVDLAGCGNTDMPANGNTAADMVELEEKMRSTSEQLNKTRDELTVTQSENARLQREATSWREHAAAAAAAHTEAVSPAEMAASAVQRPRSPLAVGALHQVLRSRSPFMGRPRGMLSPSRVAAGKPAGGLLGTGRTSPWPAEDGRRDAQSQGLGVTGDALSPVMAFQMQAEAEAKEHQALVHDLQQLEQWARELRTMNAPR